MRFLISIARSNLLRIYESLQLVKPRIFEGLPFVSGFTMLPPKINQNLLIY